MALLMDGQTSNGTTEYLKVYNVVPATKNPIAHVTGTFNGATVKLEYLPADDSTSRTIQSEGSDFAITAPGQYEISVRPYSIAATVSSAGGSTDITIEIT